MDQVAPEPNAKRRENLRHMAAMVLYCYGPFLMITISHAVLYRLGLVPALHGLTSSYSWCFFTGVMLSMTYYTFPKARRAGLMLCLSTLATFICIGVAFAINFKAVRVEGASMSPSLLPGDVLLVDLTEEPDLRYGIYVLDVQGEEHNPLIKRLVGLPGEAMDVRYGRVFAGDLEVFPRDGSTRDSWNQTRPAHARFYNGPRSVGDGQYFFLGDNPPDSRDSRHFGVVPADSVKGRAVWSLKGSLGFGPVR